MQAQCSVIPVRIDLPTTQVSQSVARGLDTAGLDEPYLSGVSQGRVRRHLDHKSYFRTVSSKRAEAERHAGLRGMSAFGRPVWQHRP